MENSPPILEVYSKTFSPQEWVMPGYKPPSTCLLESRDVGLGKGERKTFIDDYSSQYKLSEPAKYSETLETSEKKLWLNHSASFSKGKRETTTAQAMRKGKSTPGPGHYFKVDNTKKELRNITQGRFK